MLAVAYRDFGMAGRTTCWRKARGGLIFVGLIGLADPARPEVRWPWHAAHPGAGVRTLMITGDQPPTARTIAAEAGIMRPETEEDGADIEALAVAELAGGECGRGIARAARLIAGESVEALQSLDSRGRQ